MTIDCLVWDNRVNKRNHRAVERETVATAHDTQADNYP
jgi:hypothetical protein